MPYLSTSVGKLKLSGVWPGEQHSGGILHLYLLKLSLWVYSALKLFEFLRLIRKHQRR
jgi:hypothetical protein